MVFVQVSTNLRETIVKAFKSGALFVGLLGWLFLFCLLLFCFVSKYSAYDKNSQLAPDFMSSISHFLLGVVMATTLKSKYQPGSWTER